LALPLKTLYSPGFSVDQNSQFYPKFYLIKRVLVKSDATHKAIESARGHPAICATRPWRHVNVVSRRKKRSAYSIRKRARIAYAGEELHAQRNQLSAQDAAAAPSRVESRLYAVEEMTVGTLLDRVSEIALGADDR